MTVFDVDGDVGWVRGDTDTVPPPWQIGFGPLDQALPATIAMTNEMKAGEDYSTPLTTVGNGYHAPWQVGWQAASIVGGLGSIFGGFYENWTYRPEWSECGNLDATWWGGIRAETWWKIVLPTIIPHNATYLRVTVPIYPRWGQCGGFMGFGGTAYPNPENIGKTVVMRWSPFTPPTSFEYGLGAGAVTFTHHGEHILRSSFAVTPADGGRTIWVGLTTNNGDAADYAAQYCGITSYFCDYSIGLNGSWRAYWGAFTWEWVIASGPTVFVDTGNGEVDVDELPTYTTMPPGTEVRTATEAKYDGGPPDESFDDEHVALMTPVSAISVVDGTTDISLTEPTPLTPEGISWKFRMSHVFMDRPMYARGVTYYAHDYSFDPVTGVEYLSVAQADAGWYDLTRTEQEYVEATGGSESDVWVVRCIGYGQAVLVVGEFTSAPFLVYSDRWYGLSMGGADGSFSFVLGDISTGDVLAEIVYPSSGSATRVMAGGRGIVFESDLEIGFDVITLDNRFTVPDPTTYVPPEPDLGWNTEFCMVTNGRFTLEGEPAAGSMNVYSLEGGLLDYPIDWVEAEGNEYICNTSDPVVTVVYLISMEYLRNEVTVARPTEVERQQRELINYLP